MRFQQKDKSKSETLKGKPNDCVIKQIMGQIRSILLFIDMGKWTNTKNHVSWCHNIICHPGKTRTKLTIGQHFYWNGLQKSVHDICSKCHTYQFLKLDIVRCYQPLQAEIQP